jgi:hypothetical protein
MNVTERVKSRAAYVPDVEAEDGPGKWRRLEDGEVIDSSDFFKGMHAAYEDLGGDRRAGNI